MHSENTTIRLVAVDMDGTLLHDDKSISDYTLDVLRKIVKKGAILVPASGRPIGGMKEAVLNNVDGIQYAICSNGAMLMDVPEEKVSVKQDLHRKSSGSHCVSGTIPSGCICPYRQRYFPGRGMGENRAF